MHFATWGSQAARTWGRYGPGALGGGAALSGIAGTQG
jgi:hypothetical protein